MSESNYTVLHCNFIKISQFRTAMMIQAFKTVAKLHDLEGGRVKKRLDLKCDK